MRQLVNVVCCMVALAAGVAGVTPVSAQDADSPGSAMRTYRTTGARIAIGRSIHVDRNEEVRDTVVVIGGSLRVDGRVRDGIVVVGGNVELGPEAMVDGDIALVGGTLTRAEGARVYGAVSDVSFGDWPGWSVWMRWPWVEADAARWLGLGGAVLRASLLAILTALVVLVARGPVFRIARAAAAEPGRAMLVGLAAEILFVPALVIGSVALAVTIIGIPLLLVLLPLAILAGLLAMLLGFTAIACQIGEWIENRLGWRLRSAVIATILGLVVIIGPSLLSRALGIAPEPIRWAAFGLLVAGAFVEFVVWTLGLGATLMTGFGRRSIAPPPIPAS